MPAQGAHLPVLTYFQRRKPYSSVVSCTGFRVGLPYGVCLPLLPHPPPGPCSTPPAPPCCPLRATRCWPHSTPDGPTRGGSTPRAGRRGALLDRAREVVAAGLGVRPPERPSCRPGRSRCAPGARGCCTPDAGAVRGWSRRRSSTRRCSTLGAPPRGHVGRRRRCSRRCAVDSPGAGRPRRARERPGRGRARRPPRCRAPTGRSAPASPWRRRGRRAGPGAYRCWWTRRPWLGRDAGAHVVRRARRRRALVGRPRRRRGAGGARAHPVAPRRARSASSRAGAPTPSRWSPWPWPPRRPGSRPRRPAPPSTRAPPRWSTGSGRPRPAIPDTRSWATRSTGCLTS